MPTLQLKKAMEETFRLLVIFANYTFVGPIKMSVEAARGVTFSGEMLTPFGRINHIVIQSTNVAAYILFFNGSFRIAGWSYAFSWLLIHQYYPELGVWEGYGSLNDSHKSRNCHHNIMVRPKRDSQVIFK